MDPTALWISVPTEVMDAACTSICHAPASASVRACAFLPSLMQFEHVRVRVHFHTHREMLPAEVMNTCLSIHHEEVRRALEAHGGYEASTEVGDIVRGRQTRAGCCYCSWQTRRSAPCLASTSSRDWPSQPVDRTRNFLPSLVILTGALSLTAT